MKHKGYITHGIIPLDTLLPLIGGEPVEFFGYRVGVRSTRLQTFLKGTKCVLCGIEAAYAAVQQNGGPTAHINLWAIHPESGKHIMMTSDHIQPKSKNGSNDADNRQPMCEKCNTVKGDGPNPKSYADLLERTQEIKKVQRQNKKKRQLTRATRTRFFANLTPEMKERRVDLVKACYVARFELLGGLKGELFRAIEKYK